MQSPLVTTNEVAKTLHCTAACVRRWRREGRIHALKLGRLVRFNQIEIDRIATEGLKVPRRIK
jgi:excisionase family DNA binding protein